MNCYRTCFGTKHISAALQEGAKGYLEDNNLHTIHKKRVTINAWDNSQNIIREIVSLPKNSSFKIGCLAKAKLYNLKMVSRIDNREHF